MQPYLFKRIYFILFLMFGMCWVVHAGGRPKGLPSYIASPHNQEWKWVEAADVIPPKDYIQCMEQFNGYFKFSRLDLVIRLFTWESCFNSNLCHRNVDGTFDLGITAINTKNLDPDKWNFIEQYWKPCFPNIEFDWRNPQHNLFMGMAVFKNCLDHTNSYFDALVCYNWGMGNYDKYFAVHDRGCKLPSATENIIEFVFARDFWQDNLNGHYLSTAQKEIADAEHERRRNRTKMGS